MRSYVILSAIFCFLYVDQAIALTCERYKMDTNGFRDANSAESWYPKKLYLDDDKFKPKPNSKQMVFRRETTMEGGGGTVIHLHYLLTNGKLISAVQGKSGYKAPGQARYKCNLTSNELRQRVANTSPENSSSNRSNSQTERKEPKKDVEITGINQAEQKCAEIGYNKGTEKFADCVMKLLN